eukprot:11343719-Alexandrium_andersonii.AAC.1
MAASGDPIPSPTGYAAREELAPRRDGAAVSVHAAVPPGMRVCAARDPEYYRVFSSDSESDRDCESFAR